MHQEQAGYVSKYRELFCVVGANEIIPQNKRFELIKGRIGDLQRGRCSCIYGKENFISTGIEPVSFVPDRIM